MWQKHKIKLLVALGIIVVLAAALFLIGPDVPPPADPVPVAVVNNAKIDPVEQTDSSSTAQPEAITPTAEAETPTSATDNAAANAAAKPDASAVDAAAPMEPANVCTISVSCSTLAADSSVLPEASRALVPADGWLLAATEIEFNDGESAFDILQRVCREQGVHLEFSTTPLYNSAYIEGIGNLYEFDAGPLSGWMYKVNDWFPNYGCSRYVLAAGDEVCFVYSCDLGEDVGGGYAAGQQNE